MDRVPESEDLREKKKADRSEGAPPAAERVVVRKNAAGGSVAEIHAADCPVVCGRSVAADKPVSSTQGAVESPGAGPAFPDAPK